MNDYIKHFLRHNWFGLWFVLLLTTTVNIFIGYINYTSNKETRELIIESSKKVVGLSTIGSFLLTDKQTIDVSGEPFKNALKSILVSHLVVDYKKITRDSTILPQTEDEIVKAYEPLDDFYKNYLDNSGISDFIKFIREIGYLVNNDNLVESISPLKPIITRYKGNTDGFEIDIVVNCALTFFLKEANLHKDGVGTINIYAKGTFNPAKGTVENPLGINILRIKPTLISKPRK